MTSTNIHSLDDFWKWLETEIPYDDVAANIFRIPRETAEQRADALRKEKRRIRRRMGRQQRAIQKYAKINDDIPF